LDETYDFYLIGVKGALKKAMIDSFDSYHENFEEFIEQLDEDDSFPHSPNGIANYIVKNAEELPANPLADVDVAAETDVSKLEADRAVGDMGSAKIQDLIELIKEYKEWIIGTANLLRGEGFTLFKVKIPSNIGFEDIYEIDTFDAGWTLDDSEFYIHPLFWGPSELGRRGAV
jgi:hypothetical protein